MHFYETDSDDDEKKPRKLNKKTVGTRPSESLLLRNKDKRGHESWNPSRAKDIGNFPSPARILLLGPCGVGKSTLIKNLILHQRPRFEDSRGSGVYERIQ